MAVDSVGSKANVSNAAGSQKVEAERPDKSVERATEKDVREVSKTDEKVETREAAAQQKVARPAQSEETAKREKSQARPQVSDDIARAVSKQVIAKNDSKKVASSPPEAERPQSTSEAPSRPEKRAETAQKVSDDKTRQIQEQRAQETTTSRDGVVKQRSNAEI